jgi:hypothetical protein
MAGQVKYNDLKLSGMLKESFIKVLSAFHARKIYPCNLKSSDMVLDIMCHFSNMSAKEVAEFIRITNDLNPENFELLYNLIHSSENKRKNVEQGSDELHKKVKIEQQVDNKDSYIETITKLKENNKSVKLCNSCKTGKCNKNIICSFLHLPDDIMQLLVEQNKLHMFCPDHYNRFGHENCRLLHASDIYPLLIRDYKRIPKERIVEILIDMYKRL